MYQFVSESECKRYRNTCSYILKRSCSLLLGKNISTQFILVGSGARNMVTRNGNGPFDLDYNLEILKAPSEYWKDLCLLKNIVRVTLDQAAKSFHFDESQDSTSCLTALLHFRGETTIEFRFDVAIVARNSDETLCRLIHNKNAWGFGRDQYTWNKVPNSHDIGKKVAQLKARGLWLDVRDCYLYLKNLYLSRSQQASHPSFIVYIEAVNYIYYKYFR